MLLSVLTTLTSLALPSRLPGGHDHDGYGMQGGGQMEQIAISIAVNQQQLAIVNNHLYSVQTISGAQLNITPGAPGLFHLVISGSKGQVETARNLLSTVLAGI